MKITIDTAKIPKELLAELAKHIDIPESLSELANDEEWYIRCIVAENPNTPPNALSKLAEDNSAAVRKLAKSNPNFT